MEQMNLEPRKRKYLSFIYIFPSMILLSSCIIWKNYSPSQVTIKTTGEKTGLGEKINLHGYWVPFEDLDSFRYVKSQSDGIVFQEDGTLYGLCVDSVDFMTSFHSDMFFYVSKGAYILNHDTILAETYANNGISGGWNLSRCKIAIINHNTIKFVSLQHVVSKKEEREPFICNQYYMFVPHNISQNAKHKRNKNSNKSISLKQTIEERFKYGAGYVGMNIPIELQGYYVKTDSIDGVKYVYNDILMFYSDGTFVKTHFESDKGIPYACRSDISEEIEGYQKGRFDNSTASGTYICSSDSITAKLYEIFLLSTKKSETWYFKVIDRQHISLRKCVDNRQGDTLLLKETYQFVPASTIPQPNTYMKRKKWMWK